MKHLNRFDSIYEKRAFLKKKNILNQAALDKLESNLNILFNNKDMWKILRDETSGESIFDMFERFDLEESNASDIINVVSQNHKDFIGFDSNRATMFANSISFIKNLQPKIQELLDMFFVKYYVEKNDNSSLLYITLQASEDDDDDRWGEDRENISDDMFLEFFEVLKSIKIRHDVKLYEIDIRSIKLELAYEIH